jgi:hypothetical protein
MHWMLGAVGVVIVGGVLFVAGIIFVVGMMSWR